MLRRRLALAAAIAAASAAADVAVAGEAVFPSPVYHLDTLYTSMKGPSTKREVRLAEGKPRLLWITGVEARVLAEDGQPLAYEYMCHVNLDLDRRAHNRVFGRYPVSAARLATLSQGLEKFALPEGFGLPVRSNEPLNLTTQALNLNEPEGGRRVRIETVVRYEEDDAAKPLKPLFLVAANVRRCGKDVERASETGMSAETGGAECSVHWVVPPGRQETRSSANLQLALPYDTRAHYILVHAHPYARWIELYDRTDKKAVFRADVRSLSGGRLGIENLQAYSGAEGLPLFKDHEYEMAALYENTSGKPVDAMATFYVFVADQGFDRAKVAAKLASR